MSIEKNYAKILEDLLIKSDIDAYVDTNKKITTRHEAWFCVSALSNLATYFETKKIRELLEKKEETKAPAKSKK